MRGSEYRIVSKYRYHKKHAPTTARSSRLRVSLRSLAPPWLAASLRSSLFLSPQVPWVPFKFLILAGVPFANAHSTACLTSFAPFHGASCSAHLRFAYYSLNANLSSRANGCINRKLKQSLLI